MIFWLKCGIIVLHRGEALKKTEESNGIYMACHSNAKKAEKTSIFYICKKVTVR